MKISVKRFFNNASESYDSSAEIQRIIAAHLATTVCTEKAYSHIFEVGTGTGFLTDKLANHLSFESYTHLDMAFELLQNVKNSSTHHPTMNYITADAEFAPFNNNTFDLLLSSSTFQWLEHAKESIPALINLLKPEAPFHISIFGDGTFFEMKEISKVTDFGSVMPMKTADFYSEILNTLPNIKYQIETKEYVVFYPTVMAFLKHHKQTGARYTSANKPKGKKSFSAFSQLYTDIFGTEKGIPVSYHIHYITGRRKSVV